MKIRNHILLRISGVGLFTSLIVSVVIFFSGLELPNEMLEHELAGRVAVLVKELERMHKEHPADNHLEELATLYWVRIDNRSQQPVFSSAMARTIPMDIPADRQDGGLVMTKFSLRQFYPAEEEDEPAGLYFKTYQVKVLGEPYTIHIAKPVEDLVEEALELTVPIGSGLLISTAVLLVVSWFVAGRILKPIREINRMAQAINEQTLEKRIPRSFNRDELDELSASLNHMFDRLQFSFFRQKEFIANAAHELKTPVTMLRLSVEEGMQEQSASETIKNRLAHLDQVLERMHLLIRNLLELSHLELSDRLMPAPCDLAELAASVAADFDLLMEEKALIFTWRHEGTCVLQLDQEKIRRVLINLFDNAVKYNNRGGRVELTLTQNPEQVQLILTNTGDGVAREDQQRVFEQFFRGEKSRATAHGGSGLGLAIARRIVTMHGGTITLASAPSGITTVCVTLPRVTDIRAAQALAA